MQYSDIMKLANELSRKYHTHDPFELAAALGLDVCYSDIGSLLGMYTVIKRNRFIIINQKLDEQLAKTICAHELGHDRLHRDVLCGEGICELSLYDATTRPEYEANAFAAHLLIETDELLSCLAEGFTVQQAAAELCVDENLLLIKLNELNKCGYQLNVPYVPHGNFLRRY